MVSKSPPPCPCPKRASQTRIRPGRFLFNSTPISTQPGPAHFGCDAEVFRQLPHPWNLECRP